MIVEAIRSPEVVQMSQSYGKTHNRNTESSNKPNTPVAAVEKIPQNLLEPGKAVQAPASVSETVNARTAVPDQAPGSLRHLQAEQLRQSSDRYAEEEREQESNPAKQETQNRQMDDATRAFANSGHEERSIFLDKESGRLGIRVIDKETGEVLRQIPPEEVLKMQQRLKESVGAFIDHQS